MPPAPPPPAPDQRRTTIDTLPPFAASAPPSTPAYESASFAAAGGNGTGAPSSTPVPHGLRLPVVPAFTYVHEPLLENSECVPFLGNHEAVSGLAQRIVHSSGGCLLVTGFRGVGKTTVVLRMLREIEASSAIAGEVIPVALNVARPMSTEQLLFEIVRRLFEALLDHGVLGRLPKDTQRALLLAYSRTSLSFKETRGDAVERSRMISLGGGSGGGVNPLGAILRVLMPGVSFSRKRTDSLAAEAAFLAYTAADVEHDFLRIVTLLDQAREQARRRGGWQGRLVVVIDELDKLTATAKGRKAMRSLLASLKNLLTTRGIHFLFVGGPDLHDISLADSYSGNSVFESVFSAQTYIPCVWDATDELLGRVLVPEVEPKIAAELRDYLNFKARGLPRLLLRELNALVRWDDEEHPVLELSSLDRARVRFYADVQRILERFAGRGLNDPFPLPIDEDRWRMGAYYVTDWVLRQTGDFTAARIADTSAGASLDSTLRMSPEKVEELLAALADDGLLTRVWSPDAHHTLIGDAAQTPVYRVSEHARRSLRAFARGNERERFELAPAAPAPAHDDVAAPPSPSPWQQTDDHDVINERYELLEPIGRGGMGTVFRARDRRQPRFVAIKVLDRHAFGSEHALRARFEREADIATQLRHPNIVRTFELIEEPDRLALVMELVEGEGLRSAIQRGLSAFEAVAIARRVLDALDYAAGMDVARFDIKPENIVLRSPIDPVMIDFGIVKRLVDASDDRLTATGTTLGTPAYMAPEQAFGSSNLDIRADLYAVGLILGEMLQGRALREEDTPIVVLYRAVNEDLDLSSIPASPALLAVLAKALARDPERRYSSPASMAAALAEVPEASGRSQ